MRGDTRLRFGCRTQAVALVLYLVRDLGLSAGLIGFLVALTGVASVAGALVATHVTHHMGPGPTFITGMFLASAAGLVLATAAGPFAVMLTVLLLSQVLRGSGPSLYGVNQQTFRQALIPRDCSPAPTPCGVSWPTEAAAMLVRPIRRAPARGR